MPDIHEAVREIAHPLDSNYDGILERIGDAGVVLIGEASHGTYEFYKIRAEITRRLIEDKGFTIVACEADFPDAYRANCYARHASDDETADEALGDFVRFPTWMWRNQVVREFIEWLRHHNESAQQQAGFYGLDLYSMFTSIDKVIEVLDELDPAAAQRARYRYGCFDHYGEDPQRYGYSTTIGASQPCETAVMEQLVEVRELLFSKIGEDRPDAVFYAEQNARLVKNAESYYRIMYHGNVESWNARDTHMMETLNELIDYFNGAKAVVWAHNSHLGDARATYMGGIGELNLGQLARETFGDDAYNIGFTTHTGSVTAADDWGHPAQRKRVRPSLEDSYERIFHNVELPRFWVEMNEDHSAIRQLRAQKLERAIGVIYRPETERMSHYFPAVLPDQFDLVIHIDESHALTPLERNREWESSDMPETYPTGI